MAINSYIQDSATGKRISVSSYESDNFLNVLTHPYKKYKNKNIFFTNDTYGVNLNINGSSGGTIDDEKIHNGTDDILWTASAITGTWNFSSTEQAYAGIYSIDGSDTINNDVAQFTNNEFLGLDIYLSLQGWIYITLWPDAGTKQVLIYGWNSNSNTMVGVEVDIGAYVNTGNTGTWQQFNIPLSDMNLQNEYIDSLRIRTVDDGPNRPPDYYLDEILFAYAGTEAVGPQIYNIKPNFGEWYHVLGFSFAIASPYISTLADASMAKIPYNGLLGVPLDTGINYQRIESGEITFSTQLNNLLDILNIYNSQITSQGSADGVTWIKIDLKFREPLLLKPETEDEIRFTMNDNLSTLNYFRIATDISVEERSKGVYNK